jgi:23S rRNA (pseudouridine1915-N3)-methyltransferase
VRITIAAVGRLKGGPELEMVADYVKRADVAGRALALGPVRVLEVETKTIGSDRDGEGKLLLDTLEAGSRIILLDEHGTAWPSTKLASNLARWRDEGVREVAFLIGGADGHGTLPRSAAFATLALGPQTWPHKLARVMLAEQIYRAVSINAGSPYHRA